MIIINVRERLNWSSESSPEYHRGDWLVSSWYERLVNDGDGAVT